MRDPTFRFNQSYRDEIMVETEGDHKTKSPGDGIMAATQYEHVPKFRRAGLNGDARTREDAKVLRILPHKDRR